MNLHVLLHHGRNTHHISEAIFKALARALRDAFELDPRSPGVPRPRGRSERASTRSDAIDRATDLERMTDSS